MVPPPSAATASLAWRRLLLQDGIAKILPANRLRRGVIGDRPARLAFTSTLYVVIEYGTNINTSFRQNLIDNVTYRARMSLRSVPLDGIEVHVQGIKVRK